MVRVGVRVGAALHQLCSLGDGQALVARDCDQRVVESACGVDRIQNLLLRTPTLGGALLEQSTRVRACLVTVVEVAQAGLLHSGGEGNGGGARGETAADGDPRNGGRIHCLLGSQLVRVGTDDGTAPFAHQHLGGIQLSDGKVGAAADHSHESRENARCAEPATASGLRLGLRHTGCLVGVQGRVQRDSLTRPLTCFDDAAGGVADEEDA